MGQSTLVIERINAAAKFLREFEQHMPFLAAFWLLEDEKSQGYLYIVSDKIDDKNLQAAYRTIGLSADKIHDPNFSEFQVRLLRDNHLLARAALDIHKLYPVRPAMHLVDTSFGGFSAEELYLYQSPITAPAQ